VAGNQWWGCTQRQGHAGKLMAFSLYEDLALREWLAEFVEGTARAELRFPAQSGCRGFQLAVARTVLAASLGAAVLAGA